MMMHHPFQFDALRRHLQHWDLRPAPLVPWLAMCGWMYQHRGLPDYVWTETMKEVDVSTFGTWQLYRLAPAQLTALRAGFLEGRKIC